MRVIGKFEFRKGLWRNGRGVSWDVAEAPSPSQAEFGWRLSIAEIAEDCPFSLYGPVDRIFTLIEGNGVNLAIAGRGVLEVHDLLVPRGFPCDVETSCTLVDGPCRALNLFTSRGDYAAEAAIHQIADIVDVRVRRQTVVLLALKGESSIATYGAVNILGEGEAAVVEDADVISVAGRNCVLYAAVIARL